MKLQPRPSLALRLALALLGAFVVIWLTLIGKDYAGYRDDAERYAALRGLAQALVDSLRHATPAEARAIVAATDQQYQTLRQAGPLHPPGRILVTLEDAHGALLYVTPEADGQSPGRPKIDPAPPGGGSGFASRGLTLPRPPPQGAAVTLNGLHYWCVAVSSPRWRVMLMEPGLPRGDVLGYLAGELLPYLLLAFPIILLAVWLAAWGGLAPLRRLAAEVARREPDDFSPLAARAAYAELKPLEDALNRLLHLARQGIERERAFVHDAAHELRTPLAVVAAQAHVLAHAANAVHRDAARVALEQAVARASRRVGQLLRLAELDSGRAQARASGDMDIDLVAAARDLIIAVAPEAARRGIEISLDSPESLHARLDGAAFHSILENLLGNALRHGAPTDGQADGRVVVSLERAPDGIRLNVADNGPGIAPEEHARVFERFFRGANSAAHGSGLGLAIARQAARALGGELDIGPGLAGCGVGFTARLPG